MLHLQTAFLPLQARELSGTFFSARGKKRTTILNTLLKHQQTSDVFPSSFHFWSMTGGKKKRWANCFAAPDNKGVIFQSRARQKGEVTQSLALPTSNSKGKALLKSCAVQGVLRSTEHYLWEVLSPSWQPGSASKHSLSICSSCMEKWRCTVPKQEHRAGRVFGSLLFRNQKKPFLPPAWDWML